MQQPIRLSAAFLRIMHESEALFFPALEGGKKVTTTATFSFSQ